MIEVVFNESIKGSMRVAKKNRKEFSGSSSDVIGICINLDIGKISDDVFEETRKNLIFELSERRVNTEANQEDISTKFWNDNVSDINRLKEYARSGRHIRIWYSNAPFSMCGFYFVNSLLKKLFMQYICD